MKRIFRIFGAIAMMAALMSGWLYAQKVEAVLSQSEAVQGTPVQLRIVAEGDSVHFPTITHIGDVPVEGSSQSQNTSLQIINGKSTVRHTYRLILTFTPEKTMQIPSFEVEVDGQTYRTKPLTLRVLKADAPAGMGDKALDLTLKLDKTEAVVGEPLTANVYFMVRNDIRLSDNPQYNPPSFDGFFAKALQEPLHYEKGNYSVTQLRYILTPKKEGDFTIGPATAKVALLDTSRRDIFGRYYATIWKSLRSNTLNVHIKPLPRQSDLVGTFRLDASVDKKVVKANEPVNLTVTIEGKGVLDDFDISDYDIDGVTVYSDDAEVQSRIVDGKVHSRYVKKFAFISDRSFRIPSRSFETYDPESNRTSTLTIPAFDIEVKGAATGTTAQTSASGSATQEGIVHTDIPVANDTKTAVAKESGSVGASIWALVTAFAAGMASMYLLSLSKWRKLKAPALFKSEEEALKILYGHIGEDPEVEETVRKLYAKLHEGKKVDIDKKALKAMVEKYKKLEIRN